MQNNPHILICDDQPVIHETLGAYLDSEGFTHSSAYNGNDALKLWQEQSPDLILLDLMMPGKSGIEVCKEIRATSTVPIIMLTAKGEEIDRVVGLELGADDYIVKPFSTREVMSRIKAVLRRTNSAPQENSDVIRIDNIEVNIANYEVRINGKRMDSRRKKWRSFICLRPIRDACLTESRSFPKSGDTIISEIPGRLTRRSSASVRRLQTKIPNGESGLCTE